MKRQKTISGAILSLISIPLVLAGEASADQVYTWCMIQDNNHDTVYYSEVFITDDDEASFEQSDFTDYVWENYSESRGVARCTSEETSGDARAEIRRWRDRLDGYDHHVSTGWRP